MTDPSPPVVLCGRYRLERRLASGGMGEVWQASDLELGRPVAVKLLHTHLADDPDLVARFSREARSAARLAHPAIVAVYDSCSDAGREAIVLQLIDGPSLRQYLDRVGTLNEQQTLTIAVSVAEALAVAHEAGLVHRDIKPANILFGPERAMLTDFGVAKALDEVDHTATGTLLGSARYLAPEQVAGGVADARSDLYSLGIVLYECVTGTTPFNGDTPAATALARLGAPAPSPRAANPAVSEGLDQVITTLLAPSPDDRYADARLVHRALRDLAQGRRPAPVRQPAPPAADDHPDATVVVAVDATAVDPTEAGLRPPAPAPFHEPDPVDDGDDEPYVYRSHRRRNVIVMFVVAVGVSVAVIAALVGDTDVGRSLFGG